MASAHPTAERRSGHRRHTDRHQGAGRGGDAASAGLADESLFDALGLDSASIPLHQGWSGTEPPRAGPFLSRHAQRIVWQGGSTFERLYETFIGGRAVLGLALLMAQVIGLMLGQRSQAGVIISGAYALQAIAVWLLPRWRRAGVPRTQLTRGQWIATLGVDLVTFAVLHAFEPAGTFNYAALLVMPALIGGVLTSRMAALATTSMAAIMLIAVALRSGLASGEWSGPLAPAGLTGIGLFVITLLAGELSSRLVSEELAARGSLELARQQVALNRLVIDEMSDGVMVIDRNARVRAANPAARRLLAAQGVGPAAPFQLQDEAAWSALMTQVLSAFDAGDWPRHGHDVALPFSAALTRTLRLRARFTRERPREPWRGGADRKGADAAEALCVLFLEDLRSVQARSRQEKLAAMGRVSAGIAHEIRNPLAAIAQANALLQEEAVGAEQQMLTAMVADNVERLKRIVDDVMEVAPAAEGTTRPIDLGAEVGRIVADWARTNSVTLGVGSRLHVELPSEAVPVLFDADHLRRVLVNLLDNARRYASAVPGAIALTARVTGVEQARLSLASDGDPIPPDIEPFLFEPFFSTRSRGTGLGLYICRELCERYGGSIDYWQHPPEARYRNEFVVTLRVASAAATTNGPNQDRLLP
jgi:two-component system, NtrC family, sensor histidine kinase PilS